MGQNYRFVLREAKWNKCSWFCTTILQASLEFFLSYFSDMLRLDVEDQVYGSWGYIPWEHAWFWYWFVTILWMLGK